MHVHLRSKLLFLLFNELQGDESQDSRASVNCMAARSSRLCWNVLWETAPGHSMDITLLTDLLVGIGGCLIASMLLNHPLHLNFGHFTI